MFLDFLKIGGLQSVLIGLAEGQKSGGEVLKNFGTGVDNGINLVETAFGGAGTGGLDSSMDMLDKLGDSGGYGGILKGDSGSDGNGVSLQSLQGMLSLAA